MLGWRYLAKPFVVSVGTFLIAAWAVKPVNGQPAHGTAAPRPVHFRNGTWSAPPTSAVSLRKTLSNLGARKAATHFVVQFTEPVTPNRRAALARDGLKLLNYLGTDAYFATLDAGGNAARGNADLTSLVAVAAIDPTWKLDAGLARGEVPEYALVDTRDSDNPRIGVYVLLHRGVPIEQTAARLAQAHRGRILDMLASINGLVLELPMDQVTALAARDEVMWVEPPIQLNNFNDSNRLLTQADTVQAPPYNLDGSGVRVLVYDGGTVDAAHPDFGGRVTIGDSDAPHYHSTHVAGTVGGNGAESGGLYRGMAPGVELVSYGFEVTLPGTSFYANPGDIEHDYNEAINLHQVDLATNSIGSNVCKNGMSCEITGNYGMTATLIDAITTGALGRAIPVVWANGNERSCARCRAEGVHTFQGYHSTPPPACAKNQIGVGAVNSDDDSVTHFTSWGPCDDGRMKPDVCAPGCQLTGDEGVTSTTGTSGYETFCGTSMACPTVAGLVALLIQDFRVQFPTRPELNCATTKVLLAHNAVDLGNPGPDYQSGYGSVRIQSTIDFMRTGQFAARRVEHGASFHFLVDVASSSEPLVVTLAWDDAPAMPGVASALVNDLDLVVYSPDGVQHFPWTLDPEVPYAPAVRTVADHVNNTEQVRVDSPAVGRWRVAVHGFHVPEGPQTFSIAGSPTLWHDCDDNGVPDEEQIAADPSLDCTADGLLDACEPDCNENGLADSCDIADGTSVDCDADGVPDECQPDCNANGIADTCDIRDGTSRDCDANGVPDECQDTSADCNENGVWDACDIADGTSLDRNHNGVPDECDPTGAVFYVDDDCDGPGTGTKDDPYCNIGDALLFANTGDTVIVRDGHYAGGSNVDLDFAGKDITLISENGPENCIIDCEEVARAFAFDDGETAAARVEGFTIENGYDYMWGGAVWCLRSNPTFINCVFRNNTALGFMGGGVGGAIYTNHDFDQDIIDCVFESNRAGNGAGLSATIGSLTGTTVRIIRCTFRNNQALTAGGGVESQGAGGTTVLQDCIFIGNEALSDDGDSGKGGAISLKSRYGTIQNCTIFENYAWIGSALSMQYGSTVVFENSICWGNLTYADRDIVLAAREGEYTHLTVRYSNVGGGQDAVSLCGDDRCHLVWEAGNIDTDPLFVAASADDFRLQYGSPCIDAGDLDYMPTIGETDLAGGPRVLCARIDMGTFEYGFGDYACDGTVDFQDFAVWDACFTGPDADPYAFGCAAFDANADDDTDLHDFAVFQRVFTD